ncbi:MAG: carbohydrate ABC transporter permease [Clostridia bacterium]|nr:carbohydrate ABC transporter permease [Clostridia bacterium]
MRKESFSRKLFLLFDAIIMILLMVVCLYPMLYVVFASFSDSAKLMANTGLLWKPIGFNTAAYKAVAENPMILSGYGNTLFILFFGVIINITMTSLAAYFLSRKNKIMLKGPIMALMIFTMYFSGGMIPIFLTVKNLGLYNSLWGVILPGTISTYNLIIMRTSFMSIPANLEEAAFLDGAGHLTILWHVVLPLSKAIIAVMVLYYGVGHWNAWFNASIYLNDRSKYPLQLILREILLQNDVSNMAQNAGSAEIYSVAESIKYAVVVVATLPILCIYPFLQKYFVKGVMIGALKG